MNRISTYCKVINWKKGLINFLIFYCGLSLMACALQRHLLYRPMGDYQPPQATGLQNVQEIRIPTADGQQALAWYSPPPENSSNRLVVFFHGNGGGLRYTGNILPLLQQANLGFLALEYRGYPGYEGHTTEQGIYADARAALDFAKQQDYPPQNIVLLGQSLGSGVAVQMATEYPVGLVVLMSPFTSIPDVGKHVYWYLPVDLLTIDRFDSFSKIRDVHTPLYIFHGDADTLVPVTLGKRLYEQANEPKHFFLEEGRGHNNLDTSAVAKAIRDYAAPEAAP